MQLTEEQKGIIQSTGDIKINAVAGSGKTTTLIEYARSRPSNSKILYLAFNKSVKFEAIKKFKENSINNVEIETAHSLALSKMRDGKIEIKNSDYKPYEIAEILGLVRSTEKSLIYGLANHVNKYADYFFNSNKEEIKELNYLDVVLSEEARRFVQSNYSYVEKYTRKFIDKMQRGEIEVVHNFYLKKFQLSKPTLKYDYILFDEAQDASPAMLDIVLKQKGIKVFVGDTHQQIYSWRYATNSLEQVDFPTYHLSTSFRLNQDIASLAESVLSRKKYFMEYIPIKIIGNGGDKKERVKAVLARTNLGLLQKAIRYVIEKKKVKTIYFEGNINSYTYAHEGTSLYDVLNLFNGKLNKIKSNIIKSMGTFFELEDYVEKTEDIELGLMVKLVQTYGNELPKIVDTIKSVQVSDEDKYKAEIIFSTVHKCKGMEYDSIHLADDFLSEESLKSSKSKYAVNKLIEEINLLYVAITRTKNMLYIPFALMPNGWPKSAHIEIIDVPKDSSINNSRYPEEQPKVRDILKEPRENYKLLVADEDPRSWFFPKPVLPPNYFQLYGFDVGDIVEHHKFGRGTVLTFEGEFPNTKATIMFNEVFKEKKFLLKIAGLKKAES